METVETKGKITVEEDMAGLTRAAAVDNRKV